MIAYESHEVKDVKFLLSSDAGYTLVLEKGNGDFLEVPLSGSNISADNLQLARDPEPLLVGAITRDPSTQGVTAASAEWRDGATGTYTGTLSTAFPGATDAYVLTHVLDGITITYTQPAMIRNAFGAVTNRPSLVVS